MFFFNETATTESYTYRHTLSLHDALPIYRVRHRRAGPSRYTRLMPGSVNDGRSPFVVQRDCVDTSSGWRIDSPSSGVVLGSFALIFASVFLPTRPSHCPYWPGNSRFWKRSEEHTSELQSLMRISYAVFC